MPRVARLGQARKVQVCGNHRLLDGPRHRPRKAVVIGVRRDLAAAVGAHRPATTFWLTPGTHRLDTEVIPRDRDHFTGAPGAVLRGTATVDHAFGQHARGVSIRHLTITDFSAVDGDFNGGAVNADSATGWTVANDTIRRNGGAAVMIGSRDVVRDNCLRDNGQYGFNGYSPRGPTHVMLVGNEITGNDTAAWEQRTPGCGCSGGGKFVRSSGVLVADNWVHGNHGVGLWVDTDNRGFDITHNVIAGNADEGLIYETSYNARIAGNVFTGNGLRKGPTNQDFPTPAIYISESGSDPRVGGPYGRSFDITGNRFSGNWAGVVLWENADRFCGSPYAGDACTLVAPHRANHSTCRPPTINRQPYRTDCRWRTVRVNVSHNHFSFDRQALGPHCTPAVGCGQNGIFSNYGSSPSWSPYLGRVVQTDITFRQSNRFTDNCYSGPWRFVAYAQGHVVTGRKWRAAPYRQDRGSTFHAKPPHNHGHAHPHGHGHGAGISDSARRSAC